MEKKVYCLIEGRCKCVKYMVDEKITDYESIMKKLIDVINKDVALKIMVTNKTIVLQREDPDRNYQLCDIDQDDIIPDKSDVYILLIPVPSSSTKIDINSLPIIIAGNEQSNSNANLSYQITQENDANKKDLTHQQSSIDVISIDPVPSTSKIIDHKQKSILPNSPLPSLTLDLQKKLNDEGILVAQKYFISFWASYLWETTDTKPTKFDYQNLASNIVQAYPDLKGGANDCGIVRKQLSIWIRNHRVGLKKSESKKRDHEGNVKLKVPAVAQAVFVENNT